jgi:hypothetical membrane protein
MSATDTFHRLSTPTPGQRATACADPRTRVTRSLAGYGILAGPFYVVVSLAQAAAREGFDLSKHSWSQLAVGPFGWVQVANLVVTGLMLGGFSVALRRTLVGGVGGRAVPVLVGVTAVGFVLAGAFRADAVGGFPVGYPEPATPSWHGSLHLLTSGIGFVALAVAMLVMVRRYTVEGRPGRAVWSGVAPVALLGGFGVVSSGTPAGVVAVTVGILTALTWVSVLGSDTYRRATLAAPSHAITHA